MDKGKVIDPAGTLADGTPFADARELTAVLAQDPRLARCVAEKMFTFAMGRTPSQPLLRPMMPRSSTLLNVVLSTPFRMRR
jgi:hypothetical protein